MVALTARRDRLALVLDELRRRAETRERPRRVGIRADFPPARRRIA
jgi:hypothetical protein